jgi:hypothetical protein
LFVFFLLLFNHSISLSIHDFFFEMSLLLIAVLSPLMMSFSQSMQR